MKQDNPDTALRNKRITRIIASCLLLIVICVAGFWVRETPRYSLFWFKRAILQRDAESALKYIDLDSIVDNMVDQMSGGDSGGQGAAPGKSEKKFGGIGKEIILQNLPAIKSQLREQLKSAILSYNDQAVLEKLSKASVLGLRITTKDDVATVRVMGQDKIAFTMKKSSEGWKIVSLNLKDLM